MARLAPTLVLAAVLVVGCGGGDRTGGTAACADPVPVDRKRLAALPSGLDLRRSGTVTGVTTGPGGYVSATAVAESSVDEIMADFPKVLSAGGFDVVADEYEGIEADLFFVRQTTTTGSVKFTEGPCEGQVTIRLTVSKLAT